MHTCDLYSKINVLMRFNSGILWQRRFVSGVKKTLKNLFTNLLTLLINRVLFAKTVLVLRTIKDFYVKRLNFH
jgi:hypothetical protein